MVLKEEQDKLKKLLSEAIPLLCKNGVAFKDEFSIEALIGITLDRDKVMLVSINETVRSDCAQQEADSQLGDAEEDYVQEKTTEHRPKDFQRRKRKTPGRHHISSGESPRSDSSTFLEGKTLQTSTPIHLGKSTPEYSSLGAHESHGKKPRLASSSLGSATVVKTEPGLEEDPKDDIVLVKEDSSDMDLGQMLAFDQQQSGEMLSFPNVSMSSQQHGPMPGSSQGGPIPVATFHNTSQNLMAAGGDTCDGESSSQQVGITRFCL